MTAVWTERQGGFSFAGRGVGSAYSAKEILTDHREASASNPRGENSLSGRTQVNKAKRRESLNCFKITEVHILSTTNACSKNWKKMSLNKARVTDHNCLMFLENTWLPAPFISWSVIDTFQNEKEWPVRFQYCTALSKSHEKKHQKADQALLYGISFAMKKKIYIIFLGKMIWMNFSSKPSIPHNTDSTLAIHQHI